MKQKKSLSVVISAYNEEGKIEDCLESARFADEIIFVDNNSTDKTSIIARKYTSKVFAMPNNVMLNVNKNYGFSKASGNWILSLDADERVTPELGKEIKSQITNHKSQINGYWIPRKNIIFGKWIRHSGWYPDNQLRLFKKGKGKFPEEHVHEMVKVEGKVDYLKNHIIHYNYDSISQFLQKLGTIYGANEADQLLKKGYIFDWRDAIRFPVKEFVSRFFAREGYKDGFHGLMLSMLMAFYHFVVFSIIWEKHNFKKMDDPTLLEDTEKEFEQSFKEIFFWFSKEKTKLTKNPLIRVFHKALSRSRLKF